MVVTSILVIVVLKTTGAAILEPVPLVDVEARLSVEMSVVRRISVNVAVRLMGVSGLLINL